MRDTSMYDNPSLREKGEYHIQAYVSSIQHKNLTPPSPIGLLPNHLKWHCVHSFEVLRTKSKFKPTKKYNFWLRIIWNIYVEWMRGMLVNNKKEKV